MWPSSYKRTRAQDEENNTPGRVYKRKWDRRDTHDWIFVSLGIGCVGNFCGVSRSFLLVYDWKKKKERHAHAVRAQATMTFFPKPSARLLQYNSADIDRIYWEMQNIELICCIEGRGYSTTQARADLKAQAWLSRAWAQGCSPGRVQAWFLGPGCSYFRWEVQKDIKKNVLAEFISTQQLQAETCSLRHTHITHLFISTQNTFSSFENLLAYWSHFISAKPRNSLWYI